MTKHTAPRDLRAKAEFARDMADLYERALAGGAFQGMLADVAIINLVAALRLAAEEHDPSAKILDQHGNPIPTAGQVQ